MRAQLCASILLGFLLVACDKENGAQSAVGSPEVSGAGELAGGRIETGLVGNWAKPSARFLSDTLIFTETKFRTPFLSGTGSLFSAKAGLVKGGPDMKTVGEYQLSGDSLWFDGLLGSEPNGIVRGESNLYLRVK